MFCLPSHCLPGPDATNAVTLRDRAASAETQTWRIFGSSFVVDDAVTFQDALRQSNVSQLGRVSLP
jgi:hypothetical protein